LIEPDVLIDVKAIRSEGEHIRQGMEKLFPPNLVIQAMTTLDEIVESSLLRKRAPVLGQSLENAATPQVRNVGTAAGNLLQRPRCWYYRNDQFNCLKKGGATCFAVDGENQYHAVFGDGPCHIVHASNLAPALFVCEATVQLTGGARDSVVMADLLHMPDKGVRTESNLELGEIITAIKCRGAPASGFYSIKEKQSFDWPLVMCAASLVIEGDGIKSAKICAGAVAPVPWPLPNVEQALQGVSVNDDAALNKACAIAIDGAKPMSGNAYKLKLLPVAVKRAVLRAAGKKVEA
jgi:xanthine dehydrogenase YagS FAD-binding subunit